MSDALTDHLRALDPNAAQRRRIRDGVDSQLEAAETTLLTEWLDLLRARPLVHSLYALGAAALLLVLSPLASLPFVLMR